MVEALSDSFHTFNLVTKFSEVELPPDASDQAPKAEQIRCCGTCGYFNGYECYELGIATVADALCDSWQSI